MYRVSTLYLIPNEYIQICGSLEPCQTHPHSKANGRITKTNWNKEDKIVSSQNHLPTEYAIPWAAHKPLTGGNPLFQGNQFHVLILKIKQFTSIFQLSLLITHHPLSQQLSPTLETQSYLVFNHAPIYYHTLCISCSIKPSRMPKERKILFFFFPRQPPLMIYQSSTNCMELIFSSLHKKVHEKKAWHHKWSLLAFA